MDPVIAQLATQTATVLVQNTASVVASKLQTIKAQKNDKQAVEELTEIINDLVAENAELQSLAQAYKQELVAQQITENDIRYITDTAIPLLEKFIEASGSPVPSEMLEAVEQLLSVETLKVLQLLGFNFKQAIGAPLTSLIASLIENAHSAPKEDLAQTQLETVRLQCNLSAIALDAESFERYRQMMSQ